MISISTFILIYLTVGTIAVGYYFYNFDHNSLVNEICEDFPTLPRQSAIYALILSYIMFIVPLIIVWPGFLIFKKFIE